MKRTFEPLVREASVALLITAVYPLTLTTIYTCTDVKIIYAAYPLTFTTKYNV